MKYSVLIFALLFSGNFVYSQTLFTYGNNAVSKDEFIRAFNKNNTTTSDKNKALKDYLELYVNFKLKVKAAKDLKLDTLPQLVSDLDNFKNQIQDSYLNNDKAVSDLINEAAAHSQKNIHTLHFFIPINEKTTVADSLKATTGMQELYSELSKQKNNENYNQLVATISSKYLPIKFNDLGYITAFSLPYEYEKLIYQLKIGESSKPYQTKKGIHIFKVVEERKDIGKWKIAQILFAVPPQADEASFNAAKKIADSIYLVLKSGANFSDIAKKYSDDKMSYSNGGELPEFGSGKYSLPFENEVIKLKKDEEIAKPFATPFGIHIIQRLGLKEIPTDKSDATYLYDIKQKVLQDARVNVAKDIFNNSILKQVQYKKTSNITIPELLTFLDSGLVNENKVDKGLLFNKSIFSFLKSNLTGADLLNFIKEYKNNFRIYKGESNEILIQKFVLLKSLEYYKNHLEEYSSDYKNQIEEFKDGNLLFEIMDRKVWNKGASDTAGLKKQYAENKSKYIWAASADVILFNCNNKKTADQVLNQVKEGKNWKKITLDNNTTIQTDSGRYEISQIALPTNIMAKEGYISPISINATDATASFIKILKLHNANEQRSFEESKGMVISDYQNIIEAAWVEELKKKYLVKIDDNTLQTLLK